MPHPSRGAVRRRVASGPARLLAATAALTLAGCDGPPLGGSPPAKPARAGLFAACPRLEGIYDLADRTAASNRNASAWRSGPHPYDELSIEAVGDEALRLTWRHADQPDPSVILRMEPEQVSRYRWSQPHDERPDEDFLQTIFESRGLIGNGNSRVVERALMRCDHGWLSVPYASNVGGLPTWPSGLNRGAQFTVDGQGALVADFVAHYQEHGYFSPSPLWCGGKCRDALGNGHDVHECVRAPRKLGVAAGSLGLPYAHGIDVMGNAPPASDAVRERWRARLQGLAPTLTRVRMDDRHVELTFAANDVPTLVTATSAMRHLHGLSGVVVRRFGGSEASPPTLTLTADAGPALVAAMR